MQAPYSYLSPFVYWKTTKVMVSDGQYTGMNFTDKETKAVSEQ